MKIPLWIKIFKIILLTLLFIYLLFIIVYFVGWQRLSKLLAPLKNPKAALENGHNLLKQAQTIVAVGAHPDDIEWWVGGSLSLLDNMGKTVIIVIATDTDGIGSLRRQEQKKAARILGYDKVIFLGYPDRKLSEQPLNEVKAKIEKILKDASADTLITFDVERPSFIYRHPDHLFAGKAAIAAAQSMNIPHIYLFHTSSPDTVVDITPTIEKKLDSIAVHKSQHQNRWWFRILFPWLNNVNNEAKQQLKHQAEVEGKKAGVEFGESFRKAVR